MDQWLKQQPLKRKQQPVQAIASTESAETYRPTSDARRDINDGDDIRKKRKNVRRYDDSQPTYPLDLHGVEMKMNPNLNVSSAVKKRYF